ncbi:MAG: methyltransferase domain-containing protein [Thermomicrobiales bacterium]
MQHAVQAIRDLGQRLFAAPQRSRDSELLDAASHDPAELAANFRDIQRVNHLLGGTSTILRHLPHLIDHLPKTQPITILDLATGSADIPIAISHWAKQRDLDIQLVASDCADDILALARIQTSGHPAITLAKYDARNVPLLDDSFDIVLCSLSLHHFSPDEAVKVLREMHRLARCGFILNDLRRSQPGYVAAWIAAHLTTRNRLTRNDAPLSVLRAYTPDELHDLLHRAGIYNATISTNPWFRMAAISIAPDDSAVGD